MSLRVMIFCIAVDLDPVNGCVMFPSAFSAAAFSVTL